MPIKFKPKTQPQEAAAPSQPTTLFNHSKAPSSTIAARLPKLMPIKEAAVLLRVSVSTLRRIAKARALPVYRVGGRLMFELFDLSSYLDQRRVGAL